MTKPNLHKFNTSHLIVLCILGLTRIKSVTQFQSFSSFTFEEMSSYEPDYLDKFACKVNLVMRSIVRHDQDCYNGANTCMRKPEFKVGEIRFDRCECWKVDYIDNSRRCDGIVDCIDLSDERNCSRCSKDTFSCDGQVCIPKGWKCDLNVDCPNGVDESNCDYKNCTENEFRCENERCIDQSLHCNGIDDCGDRSDERCPKKTDSNNLDCFDITNIFIPSKWRCDGIFDCYDGDEETSCPATANCTAHQFKCDRYKCLHDDSVCDGVADCWDRSDEKKCQKTKCAYNQFDCGDACIPIRWRCDNKYDCYSGSDEIGCNKIMYKSRRGDSRLERVDGLLQCADKSGYVSTDFVCDGYSNCKDHSDEENCPEKRNLIPSNKIS